MQRPQIVARALLQGPGAIDHRVDPGEERRPVILAERGQIGFFPLRERKPAPGEADVAADPDHPMAGRRQFGDDVAADQAVSANDKDAHAPPASRAAI
jgi:hypothetical protein